MRRRLRKDVRARTIARSWRSLTGGKPTLIACSGGADSAALLLCLWAIGGDIVVGHIVHDLRTAAESVADRDAVADLALRLGVPFDEAHVRAGDGNAEAGARRARYAALTEMASGRGLAYVASAHHADDQLESMIMALLRGAGPDGLRGVAPTRPIGPGVELVRPMLGVTRADAEALCAVAGHRWREDATNADPSRFRAALRLGPLAALRRLRPKGARRASKAAALMADAAGVVSDRVEAVFGDADAWPRAALRAERAIVVGAGLRRCALRLTDGAGADRLPSNRVEQVVRAVRSASGERRAFEWPGGLVVTVDREWVRIGPNDG